MSSQVARADVKPAAVFTDNMVLQRDKPISVWGTADAAEKISVAIDGQTKETVADATGKWLVQLDALKAGGPHQLEVTGKNKIVLKNVLIGEVWVCSGQSNMGYPVAAAKDGKAERAAAVYPQIRLLPVPKKSTPEPNNDVALQWVECTPQTASSFSAVAYYFGRDLYKTLGVPIGLIDTSFSGTPIEAWMSPAALGTSEDFKPILDRYAAALGKYPAAKAEFDAKIAVWQPLDAAAQAAGTARPTRPLEPMGPGHYQAPSGLFNSMIHPLLPFGIRGAIWYQGETNTPRAYQYRKLFPTFIADWRSHFGQGDLPFYFVQLANYLKPHAQPAESNWAELREAQLLTLSTSNTGMATIIDIGEEGDIHPKNKQDVGHRLALVALAKTYNQQVEFSGPTFAALKIEGDKAIIKLNHTRGLKTSDGSAPKGFAIAGADKKWVWAEAAIAADSISLTSAAVPAPVAVRYGWANNPPTNLYNEAGLPAVPFRTDDWPGVTINAK